jgi:hypothetical protein
VLRLDSLGATALLGLGDTALEKLEFFSHGHGFKASPMRVWVAIQVVGFSAWR